MAPLVKEFVDFESGQLKADADPYNWDGAVGSACSLVTSPAPPYGTYTLQINQSKDNGFFRGPLFTFTVGTTCITCAYVRFGSTNFPPSTAVNKCVAMLNEGTGIYWSIRLTTSGALELIDQGGATLSTWSSVQSDTWYRIEVVWEPDNASSDWEWFVSPKGSFPISRGSGSSGDFYVSGSTGIRMYFRGQGDLPVVDPMLVYHGGCYIIEGASDIGDRVGGLEGKTGDWCSIGSVNGKITKNSATPDCDESGNTSGLDDLDSGDTWDEAGDDSLSTECTYTRAPGDAAKAGAVKVAAPQSDRSDMVYCAKWLWYGWTNRVDGFKAIYGRYTASGLYKVTNEIADSLTSQYHYYRRTEDPRDPALIYAPEYEDQFVIGMMNYHTGGRTDVATTFTEGWCYTLHAVPVLTGKPSCGTFGNMWRGKRGRPL